MLNVALGRGGGYCFVVSVYVDAVCGVVASWLLFFVIDVANVYDFVFSRCFGLSWSLSFDGG